MTIVCGKSNKIFIQSVGGIWKIFKNSRRDKKQQSFFCARIKVNLKRFC